MSPRKLGEDTSTEEVATDTEETPVDTEETPVDTEITATEEPLFEPVPTRVLAPGTILKLGNESIVLVEAAQVTYDQARNEQHFAALCRLSGNYDANKHLLLQQYDHNGIPIEPDPE